MKLHRILILLVFLPFFITGCNLVDAEYCADRDQTCSPMAMLFALFGRGIYRAVAVGTKGQSYLSGDGRNWDAVPITGISTDNFQGVTFTGGNFVAAGGDGTAEIVYYSGDGKTWTAGNRVGSCPVAGVPVLNDVAYGNGLVVAVGRDGPGSSCVLYSSDHGVTWNGGTVAAITQSLGRVVYGNGAFYATHGPGISAAKVFRSTDGVNWTQTSTFGPLYVGGKGSDSVYGLYYHHGLNRILVSGAPDNSSTSTSVYSTDNGATWTFNGTDILGGNTIPEYAFSMAASGGRLVAVGDACRTDFTDDTLGMNWQATGVFMSGCSTKQWTSLVYDGDKFIAGGQDTGSLDPILAVSGSGAASDWTILTTPGPGASVNITDIAVQR